MKRYLSAGWDGKELFVGIDVHRHRWHVTVRSEDGLELFSNGIPGCWESFERVLERFQNARGIRAVYEAGYSGFWLYDRLAAAGVEAMVTPPNKIPRASGDRVKNDRIDSGQLAKLLQAGLLRSVWVPSVERRAHRSVVRRRWQLKRDRIRIKNQIKAVLRFNGIEPPIESVGTWSHEFMDYLRSLPFPDRYSQIGFQVLLDQLDATDQHLECHRHLLQELACSEPYQRRVQVLQSIPGIGWLTAIELLLELPDMDQFPRGDQLAAYVGLTPSQFSTGDQIRMGYITRQGKDNVRAMLVEASWTLVRRDPAVGRKYEELKRRAGAKRAIVAVARRLLLSIRRMLLDDQEYQANCN